MQNKRVTICACASRSIIDKEKVVQLTILLEKNGYETRIEPDLCKAVMLKDPAVNEIADSTILACYPRAVRSLLDTMGLTAGQVLDVRNETVSDLLGAMQVDMPPEGINADERERISQEMDKFQAETGADAWYPTLDKGRCAECGKCFDFCLFGVYTIENKKVKVVQPQNCKNNCPACARMCPSKAIIFPKYGKSPINGGVDMEEHFDPQQMDAIYRERLRYRLQQRRASVPLISNNKNEVQ